MAPHRPPFTGRYLRIHQLGIGFFGEVWLARDQYLDVDVAIKYLDRAVNVGEVLLESQLLERLRAHDQVANIRDVQLGPPGPFIVMQYYPNGSVA